MGIDSRPAFYYNLACTYALLGEVGLALDYLARDFEENHRTRGSRLRQVEWAREDPDLANLRSDPRFERLLSAAESK
jgi:adenylate cyclase